MDKYATHLEALVATALATDGRILELGCGDYSTPVLAAIAKAEGREFIVQTADEVWASKFEDIVTPEIVDWEAWEPPDYFGMALLDCDLHTSRRLQLIPKLAKVRSPVVVHDAQIMRNYKDWQAMVDLYAEVKYYTRYATETAVLLP